MVDVLPLAIHLVDGLVMYTTSMFQSRLRLRVTWTRLVKAKQIFAQVKELEVDLSTQASNLSIHAVTTGRQRCFQLSCLAKKSSVDMFQSVNPFCSRHFEDTQ